MLTFSALIGTRYRFSRFSPFFRRATRLALPYPNTKRANWIPRQTSGDKTKKGRTMDSWPGRVIPLQSDGMGDLG